MKKTAITLCINGVSFCIINFRKEFNIIYTSLQFDLEWNVSLKNRIYKFLQVCYVENRKTCVVEYK